MNACSQGYPDCTADHSAPAWDPLRAEGTDDLPSSPDLNVLETYAHPYTVAVLVVAALLALCVAALARRRS